MRRGLSSSSGSIATDSDDHGKELLITSSSFEVLRLMASRQALAGRSSGRGFEPLPPHKPYELSRAEFFEHGWRSATGPRSHVCGSPAEIADGLEENLAATGSQGGHMFSTPLATPSGLDDVAELLVPELRSPGSARARGERGAVSDRQHIRRDADTPHQPQAQGHGRQGSRHGTFGVRSVGGIRCERSPLQPSDGPERFDLARQRLSARWASVRRTGILDHCVEARASHRCELE